MGQFRRVFSEVLSSQISTRLLKIRRYIFQLCSWIFHSSIWSDESRLLWEGGGGSWDCGQALAMELWSFIPGEHLSLSQVSSSAGYSMLKSQQWVPVFKKPCAQRSGGIIRLLDCTDSPLYSCFSIELYFSSAICCLVFVSNFYVNRWSLVRDNDRSLLSKDKQRSHRSLEGKRRGCLYPAPSQITREGFEVQKYLLYYTHIVGCLPLETNA